MQQFYGWILGFLEGRIRIQFTLESRILSWQYEGNILKERFSYLVNENSNLCCSCMSVPTLCTVTVTSDYIGPVKITKS